jgi:hypothetical protein
MFCEFEPHIEKFFSGGDGAKDLAPYLLGGLHLPGDLIGPVMRDMTVRASCAHTRAICEVHRALKLLIDIVAHFVTGDAKVLFVREFQSCIESAPEHNASNEASQSQKPEA